MLLPKAIPHGADKLEDLWMIALGQHGLRIEQQIRIGSALHEQVQLVQILFLDHDASSR